MTVDVGREVRAERGFTTSTQLNSISGTSEVDYLLLKNPSASPIKIEITHMVTGTDSASTRSIFMMYKNPTITTNGTTLTIENTYVKASAASSNAEAYKNPTISARGGCLDSVIMPADSPSKGTNRFYWIDANNSILVTVKNSVSNASSFVELKWLEE